MRIAALYDIHGNLPALEAVLKDVSATHPDIIVCGGDIFPGPMGRECLQLLQSQAMRVHYVMGNGDREVLAARTGTVSNTIPPAFRDVMAWCASQLTDADASAVGDWPLTQTLTGDGIERVLFCHATPENDTSIFTRLTPDRELLSWVDMLPSGATVVCGHTHMQFDRTVRGVRIINAGSVGMPFGTTRACWLELDGTATLRHTSYDVDAAARRVRKTNYPQAESFASVNILQPPSEAEMLARFSPGAG
ncbi:MAG: metallophosphoesterase family protein [Gemmatimonadaceae bacterium]|nr:metallophosphoesterase family protein [Gemmatimonadaceae bacterium]